MYTDVLKRVLPFTLTLIVGIAFGSFVNLFSQNTPHVAPAGRYEPRTYRAKRKCGTSFRTLTTQTPVEILYEPNTRLTPQAIRNETYGVVTLKVEFGADGKVGKVETVSTLPDGLTEQAVQAARQTRFNPATSNGEAITVTQEKTYYFSLGDRTRF